MRRIRDLAAALLASAAAAAGGCGQSGSTAPGGHGDGGPGEGRRVVGYSQCNRGEPWREQMDRDVEAAAMRHGGLRLIMKDAQNDALTQQAHVREFVAQGVDLIIISPKDTSLTQAVADAYDAGVPVIVLDRRVPGDRFTCFIGADNRAIGTAAGRWAAQRLGGRGSVVELRGLSSSTPAVDRSESFRAAIAGTQIRIVYDADMEWLGDKAREKMQAALARHPGPRSIDLVYGANDPAAIMAYYAARDAGRETEMVFVGIDALAHEGIEAVRNGILDATFEYPNGAREAIDAAAAILEGEPVSREITLGTRLYTKENVGRGGEPIGP
jgi:ribose transport system substrate-binding protein